MELAQKQIVHKCVQSPIRNVLKDARKSSLMQHYMSDSSKMFKKYKRFGGRSTMEEYTENLKLFFYHTINSHCGGIGPECYDGASTDDNGFALYNTRVEAEAALMDATKIDYSELSRIFRSVDSVHPYS